MDHSRVGSLYSLADYGPGESDTEGSDDESRNNEGNPVIYIPESTAIHATQARIKTTPSEKEGIAEETSDGKLSSRGDEEHTLTDSADHLESEKSPLKAEESSLVKIASIHAIKMPQLPPEPVGRCSNTLQEEIRKLLEKKHEENIDLNTNIQNRKDFRNPSIYRKLVSYVNLDETGSSYQKVKNHESAKANGT
ncbi:SAP30-binding protein-like [Acropora muricata]|uniref:SAP30-binding protein-like n=1 Tax=Acropora muricata TaxID=159855 RepID=UPI0034E3AD72